MQTMDASLVELVRSGKITQQLAERRSSTPGELKRLMGGTGLGNGAGMGGSMQPTMGAPNGAPGGVR
jgi:Tfp pilus assembly ATPase PilU